MLQLPSTYSPFVCPAPYFATPSIITSALTACPMEPIRRRFQVSVLGCVGMALWAVRFSSHVLSAIHEPASTKHVHFVRDFVQVFRPDASVNATKMVKFTGAVSEQKSIRLNSGAASSAIEPAISSLVFGPQPEPAITEFGAVLRKRPILIDFLPESVRRRTTFMDIYTLRHVSPLGIISVPILQLGGV